MDTNRHMVAVIDNVVQFSSSLYINNIPVSCYMYRYMYYWIEKGRSSKNALNIFDFIIATVLIIRLPPALL